MSPMKTPAEACSRSRCPTRGDQASVETALAGFSRTMVARTIASDPKTTYTARAKILMASFPQVMVFQITRGEPMKQETITVAEFKERLAAVCRGPNAV